MKRFPWRAAGIVVVWSADRLSKIWAMDWLQPRGKVSVLSVFDFTYVQNTGAAFGIGFSRNGFFTILSTGLLAGLAYLQRGWPRENKWLQCGVVLVAGGALGNLCDRLAFGYVVDFLDAHYASFYWPVFNLADSCVMIGACCLAWGLRLEDRKNAAA